MSASDDMERDATLSADRVFRYSLLRRWDTSLPMMHSTGLNPSVADALIDDPTIRREIDYARRLGFGGLLKTNLYALMSTDPDGVWRAANPEGDPGCLDAIVQAARLAPWTLCAWGKFPNSALRARRVKRALREAGAELRVLALTGDGWPRHPLYLRATLVPFVWSEAA